MIKKIFVITLLFAALPVLADDVNLTPQSTFSGYNNNSARTTYPQLKKSVTAPSYLREDVMKPKSVLEMGDTSSIKTPMTYDQFPQNYDSSNMMHIQSIQNGMQNMYMGY